MNDNSLKVVVEKIISGGDGLARLADGRVLFVPFSLPGETLKVKIIQKKKDYAIGTIQEVLEPSPDRVVPRCPHFGICGGCQLQHVNYDGEIKIKQGFLEESMKRQAKLSFKPEQALPSSKEWEYRSKSEHPVTQTNLKPLIGYYQRRSHRVVDIKDCPVINSSCVSDIQTLRTVFTQTHEPLYNEMTHTGNIRHLILRTSYKGERIIGLVTRTEELAAKTIKEMLERFDDLYGIVQNVNPEKGNRILGDKTEAVSGSASLIEEVAGLRFRVSFPSFFQANHLQAERLVNIVKDFIAPQPDDVLCDAYAGVGMIGLNLASSVKKVIAIESAPSAVEDGKHNTKINNIENLQWLRMDVAEGLKRSKYNLLVLDPPRKGLTERVLSEVMKAKPSRICYVSCNPATWSRDIAHLIKSGYELKRLSWLDMFPKTAHLELVSLLEVK